MASPDAKIILYTNHRCPWAHRVHIALEELKIPFEEVIIDLDTPRTPEYLKINPRGLVPALSYNGEIIIESAIVSQFLADAYPSHLAPPSGTPSGALRRARIALFADAFSKVQSAIFQFNRARTDEEIASVEEALVTSAAKEVEPLLSDAKPFFGGSDKLTLAEVLTGSFVIRLLSLSRAGVLPSGLLLSLAEKAPSFSKWAQTVAVHPSVTSIYDEDKIIQATKARIAKLRAAA
ncbi:thioredoxin-like protein [Diplogelasinospora grovesii]|uniref:Thioredoxin-like protein n=1 Tax=Diplogelasinospora grovesii TaxID=303347 RepID=A0AAN6NGZ9_9PEZI|nr:thioredoxin-like protein [Diplogelasinospora grovesii]